MPRSRIVALCALLLLAVTTLTSPAQDGAGAAQSVVENQLKAFQAGDAEAAYSHAAPNIRRAFPTREAFMAMVKNGYAPIHSPRSYAFGKAEIAGNGRVTQRVLILGPDGKDYEAVYTLELQEDGVFRITGVSMRAANTLST